MKEKNVMRKSKKVKMVKKGDIRIFTLVELLVVIAIIGILIRPAATGGSGVSQSGKTNAVYQ